MTLPHSLTRCALGGIATLCLLVPVFAASAETLPDGFPTRRGELVFFRANVFERPTEHQALFDWLGRFDLLVTNGHGLADEQTRKTLQSGGSKLFLYAWANGFYVDEAERQQQDGPWRSDLVDNHRDWLLCAEPMGSQMGPLAYYFDYSKPEMVDYFAQRLAEYRARTGYDGIFFDYSWSKALPDEVGRLWDRLHPDLPYDRALIGFYNRLRELDPGIVIFTNQAYRAQEPLLAAADWDMTESAATSHAWGPKIEVQDVWGPVPTAEEGQLLETFFRPWTGQWGLEGICREIEAAIGRAAPRKGFVYLDYARPLHSKAESGALAESLDIEAIYYSYCAAALWGRRTFCSGWFGWQQTPGREYSGPLYFADLGKPLGTGPSTLKGVVIREYERGLVALMTSTEPVDIAYRLCDGGEGGSWDLFASAPAEISGDYLRIRLAPSTSPLSGTERPAGRVYLKTGR
jgi:hypothetical protein